MDIAAAGATAALDADSFHRVDLPPLLDSHGELAARNPHSLAPLCLDIDGSAWTYRCTEKGVTVERGEAGDAATVVSMSNAAFADLVALMRTIPSLVMADELTFRRGQFSDLTHWELSLRAVYQGVPIYDAGRTALVDRDGAPLDLTRSFTLDDADDEMGHFLLTTGYLHVRRVFTAAEVASFNAEADRLAAQASPDDDRSWWATTPDGEQVLTRLVYPNLLSDLIAGIEDDPRLRRLVGLHPAPLEPAPDRMEGHGILLKPAGETEGLANIPWHQDCGLGGHPYICPAVAIGIQLTGSSPETGCFEVIAGSHGQSCDIVLTDRELAAMPRVKVPTEPGDVTLHIQDVIHASPPPTGEGGRRTMYVTYYPPTLFDHIGPGEAVNDFIRGRQDAAHALTKPSS